MEFLNKIRRAQSGGTVVQRGMPFVRLAETEEKKINELQFKNIKIIITSPLVLSWKTGR